MVLRANTMGDDLRGVIRLWRRDPAFPIVIVLAIGISVGTTCAIFILMNSLLFRPLPVHRPGELVRIGLTRANSGFLAVSYQEYRQFAELQDLFAGVVAHQPQQFALRIGPTPRHAWGEVVSNNYFDVLALPLLRGRSLPADQAAGPAVAIISDRLWQSEFARSEQVLGKTMTLNGHPVEIIGVAPPEFRGTFPGFAIDFWVPVTLYPTLLPGRERLEASQDRFLMVLGRLKPGVGRDRAQAALATVAQRFADTSPVETGRLGVAVAGADGVHPSIAPVISTFLMLLTAMGVLLVLVACANVSGLLMARLGAREAEFAIRAALGCRRMRLVRQLFTESLAATALGAAVAVGVAAFGARWLTTLAPATVVPLQIDAPVDWRVLLFAAATSLLAGSVLSVLPVLRASRAIPGAAMKEAAQGATGSMRSSRARAGLLIAQVAIATVLLTAAGLLTRSALHARTIDPGFDSNNVIVFSVNADLVGYDRQRALALFDRLRDRASALAIVERASLGLFVPLGDRGDQLQVTTTPGADAGAGRRISYNLVSPGYFDVLRVPILRGRDFSAADNQAASAVAIVTESFVTAHWPDGDGLGRTIALSDGNGGRTATTVVGVVRTFKFRTLGESDRPVVFLPLRQRSRGDVVVHVRTRGDARQAVGVLTRELRAVDADVPMDPELLSNAMEFSLFPIRVATRVVLACGVLAFLLACAGVYAMVAHRVAQRLREVGIRLALGATPASVSRLVLGHAVVVTIGGLLLGVALSLLAGRLFAGLLYGISPYDPTVVGSVVTLNFVMSVAAAAVPAAGAARVSPSALLRSL